MDSLSEQRETMLNSVTAALAELDLGKVREAVRTLEDMRAHIEFLMAEEEQEAARTRAESIREAEWEHDPKYDHG